MLRNFGLYVHITVFTFAAVIVGYALPLRLGIAFAHTASGIKPFIAYFGAWIAIAIGIAAAFGLQRYREHHGIASMWLEYRLSSAMALGMALAFYAGCWYAITSPKMAALCAFIGALCFLRGLLYGFIDGWDSWQYVFATGTEALIMKMKEALLRRGAFSF